MGRSGGGYNTAPSMLGPLNTGFSGTSGGSAGFPGGGGFSSESAPSPLDLSEFPSLSRGGGGGNTGGVVGESVAVGGGAHVGSRSAYGSLSHGWGGKIPMDTILCICRYNLYYH